MKKLPKISNSEWEVMKILWSKSPLTASEIITELKEDTSWNPKTIHTLINRLVEKKAIEVQKTEPFYMYYPIISEKESIEAENKMFVKKIYNGSLKLLFSNFLRVEKLSDEDIKELQDILNKKQKGE